MNLRYISSPGRVRIASVVLASLVTATLFGAVAEGMAGGAGSASLAADLDRTGQAAVA